MGGLKRLRELNFLRAHCRNALAVVDEVDRIWNAPADVRKLISQKRLRAATKRWHAAVQLLANDFISESIATEVRPQLRALRRRILGEHARRVDSRLRWVPNEEKAKRSRIKSKPTSTA